MEKLMALLLAGGLGTRMKSLTRDVPKPLVPYAGRCHMIDFSLQNCVDSHVSEVLLMSKHEERQIHQYLLNVWQDKINIHFGCYNDIHHHPAEQVYQRTKRMEENGTADALLSNRPYIDRSDVEHVLVLHSDHIYRFNYQAMYQQHLNSGAALTIGYQKIPLRYVKLFGMVAFDQDNNLTEFVEKPHTPSSDTVFTAVCIFNKDILYRYLDMLKNTQWKHDISHDVIPAMLANNEVIKGFHFTDYWEDIGTTERFYYGHMKLVEQQVHLPIHNTLLGSDNLQRVQSAQFDNVVMPFDLVADSFTAKNSMVFAGAKIGEDCYLENSIVLPGSEITAGSSVRNALVSQHDTETFPVGGH